MQDLKLKRTHGTVSVRKLNIFNDKKEKKRGGDTSRTSGMCSDSLGFRGNRSRQVTLECRNQRGDSIGISAYLTPAVENDSRFFPAVMLDVIGPHHQSPSPTLSLSLSSAKKFQLVSTQCLSHAHCMPDSMQGNMRMQNKTDVPPPLGTHAILE